VNCVAPLHRRIAAAMRITMATCDTTQARDDQHKKQRRAMTGLPTSPTRRKAAWSALLDRGARLHPRQRTRGAAVGRTAMCLAAWAYAQRDIYESWTRATDPRTCCPKSQPRSVPRIRRASGGLRTIVRTDASDQHNADRIAAELERRGLEPSLPPKPLSIIGEGDVHSSAGWRSRQ
jgi:hypothetical protein